MNSEIENNNNEAQGASEPKVNAGPKGKTSFKRLAIIVAVFGIGGYFGAMELMRIYFEGEERVKAEERAAQTFDASELSPLKKTEASASEPKDQPDSNGQDEPKPENPSESEDE